MSISVYAMSDLSLSYPFDRKKFEQAKAVGGTQPLRPRISPDPSAFGGLAKERSAVEVL